MKIGLMGDVFYKWDGGADYIANIAVILNHMRADRDLEFCLLLPKDSPVTQLIKRVLGQDDEKAKSNLINRIQDAGVDIEVIYYPIIPRQRFVSDSGRRLDNICRTNNVDLVYPVMKECFPKLSIPWIGHVPDLQEEHLTEYFSRSDRAIRRRENMRILRSGYVHTASKQAASDLKEYYPSDGVKFYATPFAPFISEHLADTSQVDMKKYDLPDKYFVISNQFWVHKDHKTAFDALQCLYDRGYTNVDIYCTGRMGDYRNPGYEQELLDYIESLSCRDHIHITGFIPREEQIELIKRSVALIQPSHFEGNVGGQSVYLARGLCKEVILSDIPVNLEGSDDEHMHYFKCGDANSLADKMMEQLVASNKGIHYPTTEEIVEHNMKSLEIQKKFYMNMLRDSIPK